MEKARVVEAVRGGGQNHKDVIRIGSTSAVEWLDSCCWSCGTEDVNHVADGRVLCRACREVLFAQPSADPVYVARHAYWERHALRCCWRCMTGAVDPDDDVGLCRSCLAKIGERKERRAARGASRPAPRVEPLSTTRRT